MIVSGASRRGQPLLFLAALLASWTGLRVATWDTPLDVGETLLRVREESVERLGGLAGAVKPGGTAARSETAGSLPGNSDEDRADQGAGDSPGWPGLSEPLPGLIPPPIDPSPAAPFDRLPRASLREDREGRGEGVAGGLSSARRAVGQALLTVMGLSQMQLPPALAALIDLGRMAGGRVSLAERDARTDTARPPAAPAQLASRSPAASRWSADAWLLLRDDRSRATTAAPQPSYGRSQAGAVVRYRLAPSSAHAPQAYLRTSAALSSPHEAEIAGGLSARPIAELPIRLAAEARVSDTAGGAEVRPAAYAVSEFPPVDLPGGTRGEVYVQGGYVGGKYATPFVDGQARVTRDLVRGEDATVSAGAGAWGGAQKGTSRLDIGPSAAVSFRLAEGVFSRVAIDYRVRVAGDAEPKSGPALTLSAGF